MNATATTQTITVPLSNGGFFMKHITHYKGWTYSEGLFGNTLMDANRKIHWIMGMDPRDWNDAKRYIDAR
jgi:hypothetical protein